MGVDYGNYRLSFSNYYWSCYKRRNSTVGKYKLAIRDFSKVIELNPKLADAYILRGYNYEKLGNL